MFWIRFLVLLFSLFSFVFADENPTSLVNLTAIPSSVVNDSVHVITGDYIPSMTEPVMTGPGSSCL